MDYQQKKIWFRSFLRKYVLIVWIFVVIIEGTCWLFSYIYHQYTLFTVFALLIDFLVILFPLMITIYIRQNLPLIIDKLRIKQELKNIFLIILFTFIVIAILSTIIGGLNFFFGTFNEITGRALYNAVSNISTFGTFCCVYIQSQWVINKFRPHLKFYSSRQILKTTLTQQILLTKKKKVKIKRKYQSVMYVMVIRLRFLSAHTQTTFLYTAKKKKWY